MSVSYWMENFVYCCIFLSDQLACLRFMCMSTQIKAPLSHRKHCSSNTLSVVPPLTPWLCDITPSHGVTHLHNSCCAASLARKNRFGTAALLLVVLAQVCESWPIRADRVFRRGLTETGAKTECFRRRGNIELQHRTVWENRCVFWALNHVNLF